MSILSRGEKKVSKEPWRPTCKRSGRIEGPKESTGEWEDTGMCTGMEKLTILPTFRKKKKKGRRPGRAFAGTVRIESRFGKGKKNRKDIRAEKQLDHVPAQRLRKKGGTLKFLY